MSKPHIDGSETVRPVDMLYTANLLGHAAELYLQIACVGMTPEAVVLFRQRMGEIHKTEVAPPRRAEESETGTYGELRGLLKRSAEFHLRILEETKR